MEEIVLLLEDADPAARILASLQAAGYRTVLYSDAASGLEALKAGTPDLVLLDAALPLPAPLELLPEVLGATQAPVIALAAGLSPGGAARLLDAGADDCLPYPPDPEELSARVRRSLRRSRPQSAACLQWRDITLSPSSRRVTRAGQAIGLTAREFDLLEFFLRHPALALSRNQLLHGVWGYDFYGDAKVVDVYVRYLRQKLDKPSGPSLIETVRGVGYRLAKQENSEGPSRKGSAQ